MARLGERKDIWCLSITSEMLLPSLLEMETIFRIIPTMFQHIVAQSSAGNDILPVGPIMMCNLYHSADH